MVGGGLMRWLLTIVLLAFGGSLFADAPKVQVSPSGEVRVQSGLNSFLVKPDGSAVLKWFGVELSLGGSDKPIEPVVPVDPSKPDPLQEQLGTLYGSLQEQGKAEKTKALSTVWLKAVTLVDQCSTLGEITASIKKIQTLEDQDLAPLREAIRDEVAAQLGKDPKASLDKAKARALFSRIATGLEKAVKS
jgi:hypothetical protein